jgi:hypothetical protein
MSAEDRAKATAKNIRLLAKVAQTDTVFGRRSS